MNILFFKYLIIFFFFSIISATERLKLKQFICGINLGETNPIIFLGHILDNGDERHFFVFHNKRWKRIKNFKIYDDIIEIDKIKIKLVEKMNEYVHPMRPGEKFLHTLWRAYANGCNGFLIVDEIEIDSRHKFFKVLKNKDYSLLLLFMDTTVVYSFYPHFAIMFSTDRIKVTKDLKIKIKRQNLEVSSEDLEIDKKFCYREYKQFKRKFYIIENGIYYLWNKIKY